jgi:hypothetical protein
VTELAAPVAPAPAGAPFAPQTPFEYPAPTAAFGFAGCGGPGAGQGSPKGASAPAAAGILGAGVEFSLSVDDAAPAAPAAGSPVLTTADPTDRPD